MPFYEKLFYFILLIGVLVFVHELGHFLAAKFFRVKVLKFSLGFGTRLWGFTRGETEYQIAALPLGGYVKMAGEDPSSPLAPEDRGRGFSEQKPYKRAIIAFAGPAVNLLLPPLLFCAVFMVPQQKEPALIGVVIPNEAAERAGVQPGDRVLSVDGVSTPSFEEMREEIEARPGKEFDLVVDRQNQRLTLHVTPTLELDKNIVETTSKGKIGVMVLKLPPYVGVVAGSRADKAGLRTFDRVVSVNGRDTRSARDLEQAIKDAGSAALTLGIVRSQVVDLKTSAVATAKTVTLTVPPGADALGIDRPDLYVNTVSPQSQVYAAGMRPGDKIIAIDGTPVASFMRAERMLDDKTSVSLTLQRGAQTISASFSPRHFERQDPMVGPIPDVDNGFEFNPQVFAAEPFLPSELVTVRDPPVRAFQRGVARSVAMSRTMVLGIAAMFERKVSTRSLGGIGTLFKLSSAAAESGFASFLEMLGFISINLGLMNLLPIPVLDGFHIVIAGMEGISRRPVPIQARIVAQYVGLALVLMLMALANWNDLARALGL